MDGPGPESRVGAALFTKAGVKQLHSCDSGGIKSGGQSQGEFTHRAGPHRWDQRRERNDHAGDTFSGSVEVMHPSQSSWNQFREAGDAISAGDRQFEAAPFPAQVQLEPTGKGEIKGWGEQRRAHGDKAPPFLHHLPVKTQALKANATFATATPTHHGVVEGMPTRKTLPLHQRPRRVRSWWQGKGVDGFHRVGLGGKPVEPRQSGVRPMVLLTQLAAQVVTRSGSPEAAAMSARITTSPLGWTRRAGVRSRGSLASSKRANAWRLLAPLTRKITRRAAERAGAVSVMRGKPFPSPVVTQRS